MQWFEGETLLVKGGASDFVAEEDIERMRQHFPEAHIFSYGRGFT